MILQNGGDFTMNDQFNQNTKDSPEQLKAAREVLTRKSGWADAMDYLDPDNDLIPAPQSLLQVRRP